MVATIEQINSVVRILVIIQKMLRGIAVLVVILQHIVVAGVGKEEKEVAAPVVLILKVEVVDLLGKI